MKEKQDLSDSKPPGHPEWWRPEATPLLALRLTGRIQPIPADSSLFQPKK
jgi:hypothetical protein